MPLLQVGGYPCLASIAQALLKPSIRFCPITNRSSGFLTRPAEGVTVQAGAACRHGQALRHMAGRWSLGKGTPSPPPVRL